jgi:hypothetical protein
MIVNYSKLEKSLRRERKKRRIGRISPELDEKSKNSGNFRRKRKQRILEKEGEW